MKRTTSTKKSKKSKNPTVPPRTDGVVLPPDRKLLSKRAVWMTAVLIVIVVVVFGAVRNYGFISLDDPQYVSENPHIAGGLTWQGVTWAFTELHASYWLPLIWLSHMVDIELYGLNAGGHHITNLLFHTANTVLLFYLLAWLTGTLGRSFFVAALFAVHPLHVESVVWITERKDMLSTLFWMLTLLAYAAYVRRPGIGRYLWVAVSYALALMSKPMVVTLPFVLLLLDFWPLGRLSGATWSVAKRLVWEKVPLFVMALASAGITYFTTVHTGAVRDFGMTPLSLRLQNAIVSGAVYLLQMIWPQRLALFYPYPASIPIWQIAASVLVLLIVSAIAIRMISQRPYLIVGWLWYLGTLIPVIGIVQAGTQARADRFTYIPLIGIFIMIAWSAESVPQWKRHQRILATAAILIVAACVVGARRQVDYWRTENVLWNRALAVTTDNEIAHINLGIVLFEQGKTAEAIPHYKEALRIRPDYPEAHHDLGVALGAQGQIDDAIREFQEALRGKPDQAESHYDLGVLYNQKNDLVRSVQHLESALKLVPDYGDAQRLLSQVKTRMKTSNSAGQ